MKVEGYQLSRWGGGAAAAMVTGSSNYQSPTLATFFKHLTVASGYPRYRLRSSFTIASWQNSCSPLLRRHPRSQQMLRATRIGQIHLNASSWRSAWRWNWSRRTLT
eukprot:4217120-Pleurochrysis_carterae.AAC.1